MRQEYCIAVQIGESVYRSWMPRKADARAYARQLAKIGPELLIGGIKAVAVVGVGDNVVAYEWPKGAADRIV